jgi:hypothetical protein
VSYFTHAENLFQPPTRPFAGIGAGWSKEMARMSMGEVADSLPFFAVTGGTEYFRNTSPISKPRCGVGAVREIPHAR